MFGEAELLYTRAPATGLVTATAFHGINSALTYDSLGVLASDSTVRDGTTLYSYRFTRDAARWRMATTESIRSS
jgi:hypothetical protein